MQESAESNKVRIDKWLWMARFFKTRSLAQKAIEGGKIHLNGQRTKPAKEIRIGDTLVVNTGHIERTLIVKAFSHRRGPAPEAALLYEETVESIQRREQAIALHRQEAGLRSPGTGRPTKKQRRAIHRFTNSSD